MKKVDYFEVYDTRSKTAKVFHEKKKVLEFADGVENQEPTKKNINKIKTRTKEENLRIAEIQATKKELYSLVNSNLMGRNIRSNAENNYRRLELINSKKILKVI